MLEDAADEGGAAARGEIGRRKVSHESNSV